MITEEELRRILLLAGHPQELVDAYCEWYFGPYGFDWCMDQMAAVFEAIKAALVQTAESMEEFMAELQGPAYDPEPYKEHRRPPRYAGPQNKGRAWTRQPPRLARSSCRKYRR
jgi:hypothetical protein